MRKGLLPDPEDCKNCPLSVNGIPQNPLVGSGADDPKFIIVAEGPGRQEIQQGAQLAGQAGKVVSNALAAINVKREDIYVTKATLCLPPYENKAAVVAEAAKCCEKRLKQELIQIGVKPVLVAGAEAAKILLGTKFKITEFAGTYNEIDCDGVKFPAIPTVHPAFILRGAGKKGKSDGGANSPDLGFWNLVYDLNKIKQLANGSNYVPPKYLIEEKSCARTAKLVRDIIRRARETKEIALDLETYAENGRSALEPLFAIIHVIGLAISREYSISVVWSKIPLRVRNELAELMLDPEISWIMHNRVYDQTVLAARGFPIKGRIFCTMLGHHNAFPGAPHKLQRVVSQFKLVRPWKAEHGKSKETLQDLQIYNAQDTGETAWIKPNIEICIKQAKAHQTFELDLKKAEISKDMTLHGIPVDLGVNKSLGDVYKGRLEEAKQLLLGRIKDEGFKQDFIDLLAMEKAVGKRKKDSEDFNERRLKRREEIIDDWDGVNLDAGPHVAAYLKACGIYLDEKTKTGKTKVSKQILEDLSARHEEALALQKYRYASKMYSTFIEGVREKVDRFAFAHPVWAVHKISGRWGSSPNWQNVSEGEFPEEIKTFEQWMLAFAQDAANAGDPSLRWQVVAKPGRTLVGADFSALEARIVAMLSGDVWLCDQFNNNADIHSLFATEFFPDFKNLKRKSSEWTKLRNILKRIEYAFFYGAGEKRVWSELAKEGLDISAFEVHRIFDYLRRKMPKVVQYQDRLVRESLAARKVTSFLYGRARHYPLGQGDAGEIRNFICQASGADIADTGLIKLNETKPDDFHIIMQCHDAVYMDVPEERAVEAKRLLEDCLTQEYVYNGVRMTFPVEAKYNKSWGSL